MLRGSSKLGGCVDLLQGREALKEFFCLMFSNWGEDDEERHPKFCFLGLVGSEKLKCNIHQKQPALEVRGATNVQREKLSI